MVIRLRPSEGRRAHPEQVPERREGQHGDDVEREDGAERVGDVGLRGVDHGRGGRDRGRAADARADADQGADIAVHAQQPVE
ncbi:MAG TPA: hypothetical protein VGX23_24575 [Actinocrinis sp.]|nr:hypothetical protein [Actinocrinis sp.]